ncbi:hypothetical protein SUGI_0586850 [Cryptomeria japonica]|nr:hypothetical protein SUGI_0586850 [Cryptomeria japonica]
MKSLKLSSSICIYMCSSFRFIPKCHAKKARRKSLQDLISPSRSCKLENSKAEEENVYRSFCMKLPSRFSSIVRGDVVAMVIYSYDPVAHFEESIREMITGENGEHISQSPNFLEELALCYLTVNAPEYHTFITRAFVNVLVELGLDFSSLFMRPQ